MYQDLRIKLDSSVRSLSRTVCYHLSGRISAGMSFTDSKEIVIYSDHIDFGKCGYEYKKQNEELVAMNEAFGILVFPGSPGNLAPYFFYSNERVTYRFNGAFKYDWSGKRLDYDYDGPFAPTAPDNEEIFSLLYPRFA